VTGDEGNVNGNNIGSLAAWQMELHLLFHFNPRNKENGNENEVV